MKKSLRLVLILSVLLLMVAAILCACGDTGSSSSGSGKTKPDNTKVETDKWQTINEFNKTQVCTKFLSSFTSIAKDLSRSELDKGNRILGLDSKIKLEVNGNNFWLALKLYYDYKNKDATKMSLEVSDDERSDTEYKVDDDLLFGAYLYNKNLYLAVGNTKFYVDMDTTVWNKFFPFDYNETASSSSLTSNPGYILASMLVLTDDNFVQKKKEIGTTTEYNFVLDIDTAETLKRVVSQLKSVATDDKMLRSLDEIFTSIFGISVTDIENGRIPKSSLKVDFTTSLSNKISALKANLKVEKSDNKDTIFNGQKVDITMDLKKFEIKNDAVAIPFVNEANRTERNRYIYFLNRSFRLQAKSKQLLSGGDKVYDLSVTAKIFQRNRIDNYAFMEYKDEDGNVVVAGCVYRDVAYIFRQIDGELVCTVSLPLDISTVAEKVASNDFYKPVFDAEGNPILDNDGNQITARPEMNWLAGIGYILGAMRIGDDELQFTVDESMYTDVWYNFYAAIEYINDQYEENILEDVEEIRTFKNFIVNNEFVITLPYDKAFLFLVIEDDDEALSAAIDRAVNAEPRLVLSPKEATGEDVPPAGEDEDGADTTEE